MTSVPLWAWGVTLAVIAVLIVADLILTRGPESSLRAAAIESALWLGAALAFGAVLWLWRGPPPPRPPPGAGPLRKSPLRGNHFLVVLLVVFSLRAAPHPQLRPI